MRRLLIIILATLCCSLALARSYDIEDIPNVQIENRYRFTSNPDGILSQNAVALIDSICYDLRHRGIAQVAVVAVKEIDSDDVFDFAYKLFSHWGVGSKSDSGIGVLLVEEAREIRFVTGYGIEGVLPDAICKRIQTQYMLPHFRRGDYSSGMVMGMRAIRAQLNGSELDAGGNDDYIEDESEDIWAIVGFMSFIILFTIFIIILIDRQTRKCPKCKQLTLQKESTQLISKHFGVSTYQDTYVCTNCGNRVNRNRQENNSANHRRGGGGPIIMGGGFGQGFGGGGSFGGGWGGGRFGGGGAGSRW
ncbi:MAG: TPM domain-containing protein [Rikenellaceae bacterium]|nr:TPM domain-containing protein [Rikenellaceae bacterium]